MFMSALRRSALETVKAERDHAVAERDRLLDALWVAPGHFYSPIPSKEEANRRQRTLWPDSPREPAGVDLNEVGQLALFDSLVHYYPELPFWREKRADCRYYFENDYFSYNDAITLYAMIRHCRPRRIVEIGSGFSSSAMLDTNERFFNNAIECTFIEPYPDRLCSLLRDRDDEKVQIIAQPVQDVADPIFSRLCRNDILFVDSSHVCRIGSDVNDIFFRILPLLAGGVVIHFHDVFYPFEYPRAWVLEGRAWNEAYLLRAFLQYNTRFRVRFFNDYLARFHRQRYERVMPLALRNTGGSIWLEKVAM
jgi:hypothetical protein